MVFVQRLIIQIPTTKERKVLKKTPKESGQRLEKQAEVLPQKTPKSGDKVETHRWNRYNLFYGNIKNTGSSSKSQRQAFKCYNKCSEEKTWDCICSKINAANNEHKRTVEEVRKELTTYSSCAKKQAAFIRRESRTTGVGPPPFELNDMQDKVVGVMVDTPFDGIDGERDTCPACDTSLPDEKMDSNSFREMVNYLIKLIPF
ncbi:unnamed protein product [Mytilus coruscus]|uniref:Uncharacterized protein n=1 Tax=Mytilus coruscus TaxID=42192 RepID=A0A6J8B3Y6_MYTCO|nr:unnamed protein product [Mytilus coruscus]